MVVMLLILNDCQGNHWGDNFKLKCMKSESKSCGNMRKRFPDRREMSVPVSAVEKLNGFMKQVENLSNGNRMNERNRKWGHTQRQAGVNSNSRDMLAMTNGKPLKSLIRGTCDYIFSNNHFGCWMEDSPWGPTWKQELFPFFLS